MASEPRVWSALPILLLFLVFSSACEDPSNVGLGVIGEESSEPERVEILPDQVSSELRPSVTGNIRTQLGFTGVSRVLTGRVNDPTYGRIVATSRMDFIPSTSLADLRNSTVVSVTLHLVPNYVYGDTLSETELVVSSISSLWEATGLRSDTTLPGGEEIFRAPLTVSDSTYVFELPSSWVEENASILLSEDIQDGFFGFQLETSSDGAVIGFSTASFLQIVTGAGQANFLSSRIFTSLQRSAVGDIPEGRRVTQSGTGDVVGLRFPFGSDQTENAALTRASITAFVDLDALEDRPEHFVRPVPAQFNLIGVRTDSLRIILGTASLTVGGTISFSSATAAPGQTTLVNAIQRQVAGRSEFVRYLLRVSEQDLNLNAALLHDLAEQGTSPRATLTLIPNRF